MISEMACGSGGQATELELKIEQAARLQSEVDINSGRLKRLKDEIAAAAAFAPGSKTGRAYGLEHEAVVTVRDDAQWDQDKLDAVREAMGDAAFIEAFRRMYEPRSKRALDAAMAGGWGALIEAARTVTRGAPQVAFRRMEDA
jgi:hypothetical protein